MSVLIIFIKLVAVFDLLVIAVYFGGDILSAMINKLWKKPQEQDDPFDFSLDTMTVSLSIDSIRQLYSGDAADFVEEKILPNAGENNGRFDGTRTDGGSSAFIRFDRFSGSRSSYG